MVILLSDDGAFEIEEKWENGNEGTDSVGGG